MLKHLAPAFLALTLTAPAYASSADAWEEFAVEVEQACLAKTNGMLQTAKVIVDPFGSENYGLAIISGETASGTSASIICVFDKQTKAVEIGGELDAVIVKSEK